jgi:hypothetical protein
MYSCLPRSEELNKHQFLIVHSRLEVGRGQVNDVRRNSGRGEREREHARETSGETHGG